MTLLTRRALCASAPGLIAATTEAPMPETGSAAIRLVIERYAAAWSRGDLPGIAACYHEGFVLHYFGAHALSGMHVGKAAALRALADFSRRTRRELVAILDTPIGAERGAIVVRERLGGAEVERVLVYSVAEGLLKECWVYDQDQHFIDGLIEQPRQAEGVSTG
jgi:uncharacterized protein